MRLAKQLTLDGTIHPESIAILSPYNAQASEINKRLLKEGIRGVTVCTIMKSQGEAIGGRLGLLLSSPEDKNNFLEINLIAGLVQPCGKQPWAWIPSDLELG